MNAVTAGDPSVYTDPPSHNVLVLDRATKTEQALTAFRYSQTNNYTLEQPRVSGVEF
jgi:hypothetical protein